MQRTARPTAPLLDLEAEMLVYDVVRHFELIPDDLGAAHLPAFVKTPQSVTDGHLVELARKNSVRLVTLDRGIPGSLFIG